MLLKSVAFMYFLMTSVMSVFSQAQLSTYVEAVTTLSASADAVASDLARKGFTVKQVLSKLDGRVHLRMGPYTTAEATALRERLMAAGYSHARLIEEEKDKTSVAVLPSVDDGAVERMRRTEAEANAKFGGSSSTPTTSSDLEAQALAKLGLAPQRQSPPPLAEREAEALRAMQTNTAQAEIDAEERRQAGLIAAQQVEADRMQRELQQSQAQANVGTQQSTAATFLNGLSAVIAGATATMAQNQANNDSINQAKEQQLAKISDLQQQIASRQAAEQVSQRTVAEQARQQAANQARERAAATQPPLVTSPQMTPSTAQTSGSTSSGRCPNGTYRGGTYGGSPCDCRSNSAAFNCPSGAVPSSSILSSPSSEALYSGSVGGPQVGSQVTSHPPPPSTSVSASASATKAPTPLSALSPSPSFSTRDGNGHVTLGTGSPKACATSPSGSQLPLTPGTTAGTCNPAACRGTGYSVHLVSQWTDATKTEVVGFFDNNSGGDATCTWAFHKHGVWTDEGQLYLKFNQQHIGGKYGGVYSVGNDSSHIKYACFEGIDPVDVHGKSCNQGIVFAGPTDAGTDK